MPEQSNLYRWVRLGLLGLAMALVAWTMFVSVRWLTSATYVQDYLIYYAAALSDAPYNVQQLDSEQSAIFGENVEARPFGYPPSFLLFLRPFSLLPYWSSMITWAVVGVLLIGSAVVIGLRKPLALFTIPVFRGVTDGQVTLVVGGLAIWAIVIMKRRPLLAGVLLAFAALMKPQSILLAPVALLISKDWRVLASTMITGVALGGLCVAIQGPDLWAAWFAALLEFTNYVTPFLWDRGVGSLSLAAKLGAEGHWAVLVQILCAGLGLTLVWRTFPNGDPVTRIGALFAGSLLCSPYAADYELAALSVAGLAMLYDKRSHPLTWLGAVLVMTFPPMSGAFGVPLIAAGMLLTWRGVALPVDQDRGNAAVGGVKAPA